jgi:hypothetical protein
MGDLLIVLGVILLITGIPVGIFLTIFVTIKKKKFNVFTMSIPIAIATSLLLIVVGTAISPATETDNNDVPKQETQMEELKEEQKDVENQFEYDEVVVTYKKHKITSDGEIIVYFEMENNSTETRSFDYTFDVYGWQNGIELDENYFYDCKEEENSSKEIKPGAKITVAEVYELENAKDNVVVEIRPFFSLIEETLYEFDIEIK